MFDDCLISSSFEKKTNIVKFLKYAYFCLLLFHAVNHRSNNKRKRRKIAHRRQQVQSHQPPIIVHTIIRVIIPLITATTNSMELKHMEIIITIAIATMDSGTMDGNVVQTQYGFKQNRCLFAEKNY